MHDAMTLENRGVPTVVLCTDPFLNSAFRHANTFGRRDFRPLGFPHPLGGLNQEQVAVRANELEQAVIETLTMY
jgi:hypothetical protein